MKLYKDIFFDLDHTLWDFEANAKYSLENIYLEFELEKIGVYDFEIFYTNYLLHNDKLWERYRKGFIKQDVLRVKRMWLTLVDFKITNEALAKKLSTRFLELLPSRNILFPHTHELLQYLLAKKYSLHIITNGFEEVQQQKLANSYLTQYFKHIITSETSNSLKPKKEIFDYALSKAGAVNNSSLMVGDSLDVDIAGAINAGIDQIFVNHKRIAPSLQATYMVTSLQEIENIL